MMGNTLIQENRDRHFGFEVANPTSRYNAIRREGCRVEQLLESGQRVYTVVSEETCNPASRSE